VTNRVVGEPVALASLHPLIQPWVADNEVLHRGRVVKVTTLMGIFAF